MYFKILLDTRYTYASFNQLALYLLALGTLSRKSRRDEFVLQYVTQNCDENMIWSKSNLDNDVWDLSLVEGLTSMLNAFLKNV